MSIIKALQCNVSGFRRHTALNPGPTYTCRTPANPKPKSITFPKIKCASFTREDFEAKYGHPPDMGKRCGDFPFTTKECDMLRVFLTEENAKP